MAKIINSKSILLPSARHPVKTTEKYAFLDTRTVAEDIKSFGFELHSFRGIPNGYGRHEAIFHPTATKDHEVGEEIPRIIFTNSYDGSVKANITTGLYRKVCSNGMVVASSVMNAQKFMHVGDYVSNILDAIKQNALNASKIYENLEVYKTFTEFDHLKFAEQAIQIRGGAKASPDQVLLSRRDEDKGDDLWRVFNRVQENLIRGGLPAITQTGRKTKSVPLINLENSNRVNAQLWTLLEDTAGIIA